jgi:hypothetical protein
MVFAGKGRWRDHKGLSLINKARKGSEKTSIKPDHGEI